MNNEPIEKWQTAVKLDYNGFAVAGGDSVTRNGYLWIGTDERCHCHTSSLRSLRKLRDLCDSLIKARTGLHRARSARASDSGEDDADDYRLPLIR
jgi:hypothetical protein